MYNYRKMIFLQRNAQHFTQNGVFCTKYKSFLFLHGTPHTRMKSTKIPHISLLSPSPHNNNLGSLSDLHASSVLPHHAPTMRALFVFYLMCLAPLLFPIFLAMSRYLTASLFLSLKSTTGCSLIP